MNLYEQQKLNRRRTVLVMVAFVAFLVFLGLGFDYVYFSTGAGVPVPIGTVAALMFGGGSASYSYLHGDRAVLRSATAVSVEEALANRWTSDDDRLRLRQYQNVVEEMSIAAGVPLPRAYVVPDPDPNAFATGRDPAHASIAVTDGLLQMLPRDQLQAVVAHEMGHIRNYDIRLMTVVAALVGAIALISDWTLRAFRSGGGSSSSRSSSRGKKDGGGALVILLLIVWAIAIVLAPIIARLLATMVSRRREYLADATGAELTRNPIALADALSTIEAAAGATKAIKQGSAHLCITDPLERHVNQEEGWFADLLATHPPMQKRIAALRQMAYER